MTKAEIVTTALRIRHQDRNGALSIRQLAAALDTSPMALYRHVAHKDEIVLAVTDALLAAQTLPPRTDSWQDYLRGLAVLLRDLLRQEPIALEAFTHRPVVTPAAQDRLAGAVEVLTDAGVSSGAAVRVYAALHTYTVGFCALEHARNIDRTFKSGMGPATTEAEAIARFVSTDQYMFGLDAIIRGIGRVDDAV